MRVAHNAKSGNNIVFCVETATRALDCEHAVAGWLTTAVNKLYPVQRGHPHSLVIGTWLDSHIEVDDGNPTGAVLNRLLAVVHVEDARLALDLIKGLVILGEDHPPSVVLDAAAVASSLKSTPLNNVSAVGVSAVSDVVAAELWAEIVSAERTTMDGAGKGYMLHPAYYFYEDEGVCVHLEQSAAFGWNSHAVHALQGKRPGQRGSALARPQSAA